MAAKGDNVEVGTKLTLDDAASESLKKIREGFEGVNKQVDSGISKILEFGRDVAAVALGVHIGDVLGSVKEVGKSAFEEASKATTQMRELGKSIAGLATRRGGSDFVRAAQAQYDSFTRLSQAAMVSRDDMVQAFTETSKSTILSREQLEKFIQKVALASRALPGSITEIATGFEQFRKNVITADNPLITMIKQANLLRGHSEQIALRLQYMGRPGALALANKALAIMQERAKALPPTFEDLQVQLEQTKTDLLRIIGQPMLAAITPEFQRFQRFIADHRSEIEKYARLIGRQVGVWVTDAARLIERGFSYLKAHGDEIKKSIVEAWTFAKQVVDFIWSHRKELALALAGSRLATSGAGGAVLGAVGGAGGGVLAFGKFLGTTTIGFGKLSTRMSEFGYTLYTSIANMKGLDSGTLAAAKGLGALALAAGAAYLAITQFQKLKAEISAGGPEGDASARFGALKRAAAGEARFSPKQLAEMAIYAKQFASELGTTAAEIDKLVAEATQASSAIQAASSSFKYAQDAVDQGLDPTHLRNAATLFRLGFDEIGEQTEGAAIDAAARAINGSEKLRRALLDAGTKAGLDLDKVADKLGDKIGDFAKKLHEQAGADAEKKATGNKGAVTNNVFNGNIWQIKQDFRDQDPDRVLLTFQEDIAAAAENRLQARTTLPFGG